MRWSFRCGYKKRQERLRDKTKFTHTGPVDRTMQDHMVKTPGWLEAADRSEGKALGQSLYWDFCGKGKGQRGELFR